MPNLKWELIEELIFLCQPMQTITMTTPRNVRLIHFNFLQFAPLGGHESCIGEFDDELIVEYR